jgi:hypothetical protein
VQLQDVPASFSREDVARFYAAAMKSYFEYKDRNPSALILEIKSEDFMKDKIAGLQNIYRNFGMDGFEQSVPAFMAYLENNPPPRDEPYAIHVDTVHYVNHYAYEIVRRLGYPLRTTT